MNDIFKTLYITSGHPEDAFLRNPTHTEVEYEEALRSPEYREFLKDINDRFLLHLDASLTYQLYESKKMLDKVYSGEIDPKHMGAISKHYLDSLKLTQPILERLAATVRKEEQLNTLEIVVLDRNGTPCE